MTLIDHVRNFVRQTPHDVDRGSSAKPRPTVAAGDTKPTAPLVPFYRRAEDDVAPAATDASVDPVENDALDALAASSDSPNIVHDVLKGLDVWFKLEVSGLEGDAAQQAHLWAEHGLPRHDLHVAEPLEVEHLLVGRALEIYWNWVRKARRRVTGAVNRELRQVSKALADAVIALESYRSIERALHEMTSWKKGVPRVNAVNDRHQGTIRLATRRLHYWFWALILGLVTAEFVANAPVFTELFPSSIEVERRVNDWLASDTGWIGWAGIKRVSVQILAAPEPALLAFGIVAFLLFLGHAVGEAWRTRVVLRTRHQAVPEPLRVDLRCQALAVLLAGSAGIVIALAVLYTARARVLPMAEERLESANQQIAVAEKQLAAAKQANNPQVVGSRRDALWLAQEDQAHRSRRVEYATSISRLNTPISGLNLVLVIVAAVAGYFRYELQLTTDDLAHAEPRLGDDQLGEPRCSQQRLAELRNALTVRRSELNASITLAELAYARAQQLAQCDPTAQWDAVVERLGCVVRTFRAENARLRRLDPRDIHAFLMSPPGLNVTRPVPESVSPHIADLLAHQGLRLAELTSAYEETTHGARSERRTGGEEAA